MHPLLEDIFVTKTFTNSNKEIIKIRGETGKAQCEFLQKIINDNGFSNSVEIGFAHGMSTLAITEGIVKRGGKHIVIDKYQKSNWGGNGLDLISQAGYTHDLIFHEDYCFNALYGLLKEGKRFDFAYIDSTKLFDWLLVDFFLLDKMLIKGAVIVFDDVSFPGIRKLLRFLSQIPSYKVYQAFPENKPLTALRKIASVLRHLPKSSRYVREDIITSDFALGINAHCVALQKIDEDHRHWKWHKEF